MPKRERFYVREHSGYAATPPKFQTAGNAVMATEYMVIDRDYCHRVIRSWAPLAGVPLAQRARHATDLAERLNREHAE